MQGGVYTRTLSASMVGILIPNLSNNSLYYPII